MALRLMGHRPHLPCALASIQSASLSPSPGVHYVELHPVELVSLREATQNSSLDSSNAVISMKLT